MSLKSFHLIFITAAIALAFGFGAWWLRQYWGSAGGAWDLVFGLVSIASGVGLVFYERYFLKKTKGVSYL